MNIKEKLDSAIIQYEVIPVGWGYIDLITRKEMISPFVNELNSLKIKIVGFSWWCFVDNSNVGCPHGMGGPKNIYGDGWFSEVALSQTKEFPLLKAIDENNRQYADYIFTIYPNEKDYRPCYTPGFYLDVPDSWRNEQNAMKKPAGNGEPRPDTVPKGPLA